MNEVVFIVVSSVMIAVVFTLAVKFALSENSKTINSVNTGIYILNKFEPDNTAPKITEMIEFHKQNEKVKYTVD